jgi:predicted esterase
MQHRQSSADAAVRPRSPFGPAAFLVCACVLSGVGVADELTLKNGIVLKGEAVKVPGITATVGNQNNKGPVPNISFWLVDDGVRRYFVFRRLVEQQEDVARLAGQVTYKLRQQKSARTAGFSTVGGFAAVQPFDEFGRRRVDLPTQKGVIPVLQAITELRPDYARVESTTHVWEYGLDTKFLPREVIHSLIEKSSNRDDPAERKAAVLFYLQAEMYPDAQEELRQLAGRFPDLAPWRDEVQRQVGELVARLGLNEIERRREAGQHQLAWQYARQFPSDLVSADVHRRAQEIADQYEHAVKNRDRALVLLDMLQAELPRNRADRLSALRAVVQGELGYETLERLEPFLRAGDDPTLTPAQKLALAYSGWLLGSAQALVDLDETLRLWDARFLTLEFLRTDRDPIRDEEILKALEGTEGVSVERLARMLALLPVPFQASPAPAGSVVEQEIPAEGEIPAVKYSALLPPEYTPTRRYPLLVVLRGERSSCENEIRWWGGDAQRPGWAQRRGYIVIAPQYCEDDAVAFHPGSREHDAVLRSIEHVRKRYRIDSDRVFLAGHGMGGDACFDIALSHPGIFAGAMPIVGMCDAVCRPYWDNAPHLAWYIVGGERDRNALENNAAVLNEMMEHGQDVIYCDYKERGFETYYEEQEKLFDWMQVHRRAPLGETAKWTAGSLRKTENRFYWLEAHGLPDKFYPPIVWNGLQAKLTRPKSFEGLITNATPDDPASGAAPSAGAIFVTHPGDRTTIWLAPETFDFKKKYRVRVNLKYVLNDYVKPSIKALLSDVRQRGDREWLYWARLDF